MRPTATNETPDDKINEAPAGGRDLSPENGMDENEKDRNGIDHP